MKRSFALLFFVFSFQLSAAPMVRVLSIKDARTIVVDNRGVATEVTLAQVVIPPADEAAATSYLRQSLTNAWVMVERDAGGAVFVYRSPDALFVNGELARRAYAMTGTSMVYLGEVNPGPRRVERSVAPARAPAPHTAPVHRRRRRR